MKEKIFKLIGITILFFTTIITLKLFLLLKLEIMLILFFIPFVFQKELFRDFFSKNSFSFFIDNIVIVTWITTSIQLILSSTKFSYSTYELINISLFVILSYILQFIMKKLYILKNKPSVFIKIEKFKFTDRERELIQYLIKGLKYKEIATELFISENTVKKHISNIYAKAGVKNKVELIYKISH